MRSNSTCSKLHPKLGSNLWRAWERWRPTGVWEACSFVWARAEALYYLVRNPGRPLCRAEQYLKVSRSSSHDMMHNRQDMFSQKIHITQPLERHEWQARIWFANWCLQFLRPDRFFRGRIFFMSVSFFWMEKPISVTWEFEKRKILIKERKHQEIQT